MLCVWINLNTFLQRDEAYVPSALEQHASALLENTASACTEVSAKNGKMTNHAKSFLEYLKPAQSLLRRQSKTISFVPFCTRSCAV